VELPDSPQRIHGTCDYEEFPWAWPFRFLQVSLARRFRGSAVLSRLNWHTAGPGLLGLVGGDRSVVLAAVGLAKRPHVFK
jgi:hypothetical protein